MNDVLDNIRNLRTEQGYSQDWMGKRLGLTQNGYSLIEAGKRGLSYKLLNQIAIIFGLDVINLITYPEKWGPVDSSQSEYDVAKVVLQIELKKETR